MTTNINAYGIKLAHIFRDDVTLEEISGLFNIPVNRMHKTIQYNIHIHDITHEEEQRIIKSTRGQAKYENFVHRSI